MKKWDPEWKSPATIHMEKKKHPSRGLTVWNFFLKQYREDHKGITYKEAMKNASIPWKGMSPKQKKRFQELADEYKMRVYMYRRKRKNIYIDN